MSRRGSSWAGNGPLRKVRVVHQKLHWLKCFALVVACGAGVGCGMEGKATGATCPQGSTLTYANFGQAFLSGNCLQCHNGRKLPNLSSQAGVQANIAAIDKMAAAGPDATNTAMPDGGSVADADRQKLGEWLACG